ncbi:hypothetical protein E5H25_18065 [Acinetobacter baumannii]|uniref:hypothetical protein n=1 Tax=Acinetobacter baumannii TaxID=470 RepID=UPI0010A34D6C|nr:hypothetical protein [Acinetobacter baumannii]MDO7242819.1 hypothetical protein [Acinetobacter baumannii]THD86658.1 hypothetical protein E5H25_18065 [Acinetobacter baumannii]HAV4576031.1 hypothetical protein [Acinetobacter baumannii]HDQ4387976.1 hypothetical protein [Acinetobacter baumannii]
MDSVSRSELDCVICGEKENQNVCYDLIKYDEVFGSFYEWRPGHSNQSFYTEKEAILLAESKIYENRVKNIRVMKLMPNRSWVKVDLKNSPYASQFFLS